MAELAWGAGLGTLTGAIVAAASGQATAAVWLLTVGLFACGVALLVAP